MRRRTKDLVDVQAEEYYASASRLLSCQGIQSSHSAANVTDSDAKQKAAHRGHRKRQW